MLGGPNVFVSDLVLSSHRGDVHSHICHEAVGLRRYLVACIPR